MRYQLRKIVGGLAATLLLVGVGLGLTATAASASAFHPIKNTGTSLCLQPQGGSRNDGAPIVQMPCDPNNAAQGWYDLKVGTHHYRFLNQNSGYCFDVFGRTVNGTPLIQGQCKPISNEEFNTNVDLPNVTILEARAGFRDTGFCVDVPGGAAVVGASMQIWVCNGTLAQRWVVGYDL